MFMHMCVIRPSPRASFRPKTLPKRRPKNVSKKGATKCSKVLQRWYKEAHIETRIKDVYIYIYNTLSLSLYIYIYTFTFNSFTYLRICESRNNRRHKVVKSSPNVVKKKLKSFGLLAGSEVPPLLLRGTLAPRMLRFGNESGRHFQHLKMHANFGGHSKANLSQQGSSKS